MSGFFRTYSRSQVTALAATIIDFGTLTLSVEVLHIYYPYAVAMGAALGAITNFFLNRHWAFEASDGKLHVQGARYALVSTGSLALNTIFVWLVTEKLGLHYMISKVFTALLVGFFYNYPMHRYFVYEGTNRDQSISA